MKGRCKMNCIDIIETLIGSFFGAFFAFLSGILVSDIIEKCKQKLELKRYFGLLDHNQESIEEIWRLLNQGIQQGNLMNQIITIRDSSDPKHKLYDIKEQGVNLTLEIYRHCKKNSLQEIIFRQIDVQDKVFQLLCGLNDLSETELKEKLGSSKEAINNAIVDMNASQSSWITIKTELKKLRLFYDLAK